jgi:3-deoxy-D-manno-octulosonic-acid transferase
VYLLDTLGELAFSYSFALGAFVGGTIKGTGHNVMEPVMLGLPVCYGPMRGHFEDLQLLCEQFAVGFRCFTSDEMSAHWIRVLTDEAFRDEIRARSEQFLQQEGGATDKTVDALVELIESVGR